MKIAVFNQQTDLVLHLVSVRPIVKEVLKQERVRTDEVAVYFVSSETICSLHQKFFNDPSPTDCISLPVDSVEEQPCGYHLLGEVFVCPKTAIDYTQALSDAAYNETTLYLVHALLHLIGYKDIEEEEKRIMLEAERGLMHHLSNKQLLLKGKKGSCSLPL
jgi:probable rRNA maturation factor